MSSPLPWSRGTILSTGISTSRLYWHLCSLLCILFMATGCAKVGPDFSPPRHSRTDGMAGE